VSQKLVIKLSLTNQYTVVLQQNEQLCQHDTGDRDTGWINHCDAA
jgi:hypothetical protein